MWNTVYTEAWLQVLLRWVWVRFQVSAAVKCPWYPSPPWTLLTCRQYTHRVSPLNFGLRVGEMSSLHRGVLGPVFYLCLASQDSVKKSRKLASIFVNTFWWAAKIFLQLSQIPQGRFSLFKEKFGEMNFWIKPSMIGVAFLTHFFLRQTAQIAPLASKCVLPWLDISENLKK